MAVAVSDQWETASKPAFKIPFQRLSSAARIEENHIYVVEARYIDFAPMEPVPDGVADEPSPDPAIGKLKALHM
jgi:hypothetical protein